MDPKTDQAGLVQSLAECIRQASSNPTEQSIRLREIFDELTEQLLPEDDVDQIEAPNAVLEIVDEVSGRLVRRYLELGYQENDNGIRLSGEDLNGQEIRIVFLSNQALEKIHDLQGMGLDDPRCDHSSSEV